MAIGNGNVFLLLLLLLICLAVRTSLCGPILGNRVDVEDNSKVQGMTKPIFVYCDAIGNHLNCMLYCKSMGHGSGHCRSDFMCHCL